VRAYPAIVDRRKHVDLTLLESREAALTATREGVRRLCWLASQRALGGLGKRVPPPYPRTDRMPHPRSEAEAFVERALLRVVEEAFGLGPGAPLPRNADEFSALLAAGQRRLDAAFERVTRALGAFSAELDKLQRGLAAAAREPSGTNAARDIRTQLELLLNPDPLGEVELAQLEQYPRYLRAAQTRLARAIIDPRKDADKSAPLAPIWALFLDKRRSARDATLVRLLHCELEELRVAIFAPELKPARSVNPVALARDVAALR